METQYYRNTVTIVPLQRAAEIEPGWLWKREGNLMTLVDEDQYITAAYDVTKFNLEKKKS